MRIAVLSDTHDRLPDSLLKKFRRADEIWHLGDVCEPALLHALAAVGPPLRVVAGNCDSHPWPPALDLEREGVRCHLVHIPPPRAPAGAHAVLHGHTHVPRDEIDAAGVRWLNPGCITRPRAGSAAGFAWLTVGPRKQLGWQRIPV
jgi:putative phosphoesterase